MTVILIYFSAFRRIMIIHSLGLKYKGIWEFQVIFSAGKFQFKCFLIGNEVDIFEICGVSLVIFDHLEVSFIYPGRAMRKKLMLQLYTGL